jgi:tRNA dimethylallyltransferase
MTKTIVIVGPTSSGKSSLAIHLSKKFNGEIISADSRQVYKGMDIGSGKVSKMEQHLIPHHLLDVASPKKQFTVSQYKKLATKALKDIKKRGHVPFIVGGTAFYVYSLIDGWEIPNIKPNAKLRKELSKKSVDQLFKILKRLDPKRAKTIDPKNPARLIRAIEIVKTSGKPVPTSQLKQLPKSDVLILGVNKSAKDLSKAIDKRVDERLKKGMVSETKKLLKSGVSAKRLKQIGLTYGIIAEHLSGKISKRDLPNLIKTAEKQLAKRQMTWFKRDKRIDWIKSLKDAKQKIKLFL